MEPVEVLVVGAGPTGLTLAAALGAAGVDVRIIDAAPGGARESSRATTVHAATLAQLDVLDGAGRAIAGQAARARGSTLWHGRRRVARVQYDRMPGRYAHMANLPQQQTEAVLRDRLGATGHDVGWGLTLESLDADGTAVAARLGGEQGEQRIRSRFVVGCDGAHSTVRRKIGAQLEGRTHPERFLLADAVLRTDLDPDQTHMFVSTRGVLGVMPMPDGSFRFNGTLAGEEDATPDALPGLMAARLGNAADRVMLEDVRWSATYQTHSRCADRYRAGNVFLAGDAAHLVSPVGGQGMNLGIQDAVNLGWKLAAVLRRGAPEPLLDSYAEERRPVAQRALRTSEMMTRMFTARHPVERALRNSALRVAHRVPPVQRRLAWEPAGLLQTYASAAVATTSTRRSAMRPGRQLAAALPGQQQAEPPAGVDQYRLLLGGEAVRPAFTETAARYRLHMGATTVPDGPPGVTVLVRPDGVIGWAGTDAHELSRHLATVLGPVPV